MPLTADDFREELYRIMDEAVHQGSKYVDVNAGELHSGLGGYPGRDHRVPICCKVMKSAMAGIMGICPCRSRQAVRVQALRYVTSCRVLSNV